MIVKSEEKFDYKPTNLLLFFITNNDYKRAIFTIYCKRRVGWRVGWRVYAPMYAPMYASMYAPMYASIILYAPMYNIKSL